MRKTDKFQFVEQNKRTPTEKSVGVNLCFLHFIFCHNGSSRRRPLQEISNFLMRSPLLLRFSFFLRKLPFGHHLWFFLKLNTDTLFRQTQPQRRRCGGGGRSRTEQTGNRRRQRAPRGSARSDRKRQTPAVDRA